MWRVCCLACFCCSPLVAHRHFVEIEKMHKILKRNNLNPSVNVCCSTQSLGICNIFSSGTTDGFYGVSGCLAEQTETESGGRRCENREDPKPKDFCAERAGSTKFSRSSWPAECEASRTARARDPSQPHNSAFAARLSVRFRPAYRVGHACVRLL